MQTGKSRARSVVAAVLALSVIGGAVAVAGAQTPPPAGPPQGNRLLTPEDRAAIGQVFWQRIQQRLGLTDQQVADVRALVQQRRDAARAELQALGSARRDLRAAMSQPTVDQSAVSAAAGQVKALQNQLFDERLQTQLAIRAKLTPEQWQRWTELRRGMGRPGMTRGGMQGHGGMLRGGMQPGMGL